MTTELTESGYLKTREKLAALKSRFAAIQSRSDLSDEHRAQVERSYRVIIGQYLREIRLYDAKQR